MAKYEQTAEQPAGQQPLVLKDPPWAAFLAWLLPGLGHWYQGRKPKAALFFICIMGLFVYGLYLGGSSKLGWGRVVYYGGRDRLPFICQIGIGAPAFPALFQAMVVSSGGQPWCGGFMAPPKPDPIPSLHELAILNKELHGYWELGTVYTMVAGLLNILAVFDAAYGPVVGEDGKKDEEEDEEEDKEDAKEEPSPEPQQDGEPA
jgi:hypothetical protein